MVKLNNVRKLQENKDVNCNKRDDFINDSSYSSIFLPNVHGNAVAPSKHSVVNKLTQNEVTFIGLSNTLMMWTQTIFSCNEDERPRAAPALMQVTEARIRRTCTRMFSIH